MIRKDELLDIDAEEPEMLYAILCKLPKPLDLESLITLTTSLFAKHPPETLPFKAWRQVSSCSVLKTTQDLLGLQRQSLEDGESWLKKQSAEIERADARARMMKRFKVLAQKYRRPAGAVALAVFVGVLSFWLGRNGPTSRLHGPGGVLSSTRLWIAEVLHQAVARVRP